MLASRRLFLGLFASLLPLAAAPASADEPATVAEAAAMLNLATFPLMPGGESKASRRLAGLDYTAQGDVRGAYAFQKKMLEERGWKEAPGGYQSDQSSSGTFVKGGYTISVTTTPSYEPNAAGKVDVHLTNHGNVEVGKLPVPPDARPLYSFPTVAAYVTEKPVKETADAIRTLMTAQGWAPYGQAGDSLYFKKNAVKVSAFPSTAPAQGGKTVIQLSSELMSVDLPAPAEAVNAAYADVTKALSLEVDMTPQALVAFYKDRLGRAGWKPTTEQASKIDFRDLLIFRNEAKDILTLKIHESNGKLRADLEQRTAAELEEAMRLAREAEAKRKADAEEYARKAAEKEAQNRVKVAIKLPAGANSVKHARDELEFRLPAGQAAGAVKAIHSALVRDGWKGKTPKFEPLADSASLDKKPAATLVIAYFDTGFGAAEVRISTFGSDIELAGSR
ncbi:hypothetical protein [Paludisphaera rhizosphaerae]|uniref:hypothetical protein n=1 Tax=Paludisphaera rhizosphaerae TaxID=2711216 RepID=UPI0013EC1017|nr:hypothetical protein [Paludisphaera rhizosphaerae]